MDNRNAIQGPDLYSLWIFLNHIITGMVKMQIVILLFMLQHISSDEESLPGLCYTILVLLILSNETLPTIPFVKQLDSLQS